MDCSGAGLRLPLPTRLGHPATPVAKRGRAAGLGRVMPSIYRLQQYQLSIHRLLAPHLLVQGISELGGYCHRNPPAVAVLHIGTLRRRRAGDCGGAGPRCGGEEDQRKVRRDASLRVPDHRPDGAMTAAKLGKAAGSAGRFCLGWRFRAQCI